MSSGDKISFQLCEALRTSNDLTGLKKEIDDFKTIYYRSYQGAMRHPLVNKLFDAMEEAIDMRSIKE